MIKLGLLKLCMHYGGSTQHGVVVYFLFLVIGLLSRTTLSPSESNVSINQSVNSVRTVPTLKTIYSDVLQSPNDRRADNPLKHHMNVARQCACCLVEYKQCIGSSLSLEVCETETVNLIECRREEGWPASLNPYAPRVTATIKQVFHTDNNT